MTREELAYRARVDRKTFYRYVKVIRTSFALWACDRGKEPSAVVKWIANNYGVSIDDE